MQTRVRYAPSPTGLQHIGGVRTALFNYLFARATGGAFILRVEDTDRARTTPEAVQNLYDTFSWLGVRWDEGPDVGGPCAPYVQSERGELYKAKAAELVAKGRAYPCFCSAERLDALRVEQEKAKAPVGYDGACRSIDPSEAARRVAAGERHVIRLMIPKEAATSFSDALLGAIEWKNADVNPDPVLLKSDGYPTYHLANVVDDHEMGITHVMRAQEWLPSTPIHIMLYSAFGWKPPVFCHLPMVMGQDGKKLSKRHGATSVDEFRKAGYLPEALLNYVGMLGASYEEGRDILSLEEMGQLFSIDKLNKAPAVFDYKKLEWFNGQYIRMKPDAELARLVAPYLAELGFVGQPASAEEMAFVERAMPLVKERLVFLKDAAPMMAYLFRDPPPPVPDDLVPKKGTRDTAFATLRATRELAIKAAGLGDAEAEEAFRALAEAMGIKLGDLMAPLRVAVTGSRVSPPLFGSLRLLGAGTVERRIDAAIARLA
jgi:glutamyl-tRNA synthetase